MEEYPKVKKRESSNPISIQIFEDSSEHWIRLETAILLYDRLRIVLKDQRLQGTGEDVPESVLDVEINEEQAEINADISGKIDEVQARITNEINRIDKRIDDFLRGVKDIDKRMHRLESLSESAIGTTWRNMTALEEWVRVANERLLTRISALEKANTDGACTATEPVARDCDTCAFCVCGADVPGLGECQQCGENTTGSGCSNPPCSNHAKWEPATPDSARKALGKPPGPAVSDSPDTDFGDCEGMDCGMCRHDDHCDDDCVDASLFVCDASRCNGAGCSLSHRDHEDARKFANERDAVAYALGLGIVDRFVKGEVKGDGAEIEVGDLVSRGGGSDRWVVTISYPALRAVRVLCVCAGSDWSVSDQGAISVDDASLIAKAGKWGS